MSDIINTLSSQTGISADQIRSGLGSILKTLQDQLPADLFSKIGDLLPDSGELISGAESAAQASSGMLKSVTDLAGKFFGAKGEAATDLFGSLGQLGFSADQLQAFLPKVLEFFQDKLPPEILEKVKGLIPGLPEITDATGA